jgi:predicted dehydrogenase
MRIGVLGAGNWGRNIVRTIAELGVLDVVADPSDACLKASEAVAKGARLVRDAAEVLRDPRVDAVAIATPAETHSRVALDAIAAGKDVFVEKPLALRVEDGMRVVEAARKAKRILMVGHLLEYHPAFLELRRLVAAGELGTLRYVHSTRLSLGKVRREENVLWSFAPHDIAMILRLVGELPFEVATAGGAYVQPNIADTTVTQLLFDNGVRAHVYVSWLHPFKEQRLVVVGSKRMAVLDDVAVEHKLVLHDQRVELRDGELNYVRGSGTPIPVATGQPLRAELEQFVQCVERRTNPLTDGPSAMRVLSVLQAAQRSLITNGQPVPLSPPSWAGAQEGDA